MWTALPSSGKEYELHTTQIYHRYRWTSLLHLLCYKLHSAFQSVGNLYLSIIIVYFNSSTAAKQREDPIFVKTELKILFIF